MFQIQNTKLISTPARVPERTEIARQMLRFQQSPRIGSLPRIVARFGHHRQSHAAALLLHPQPYLVLYNGSSNVSCQIDARNPFAGNYSGDLNAKDIPVFGQKPCRVHLQFECHSICEHCGQLIVIFEPVDRLLGYKYKAATTENV